MSGVREDGLPENWEALSLEDARALGPPPGAKERVRLQVAITLGLGATLGAAAGSSAAAGAAAAGGAASAAAGQAPVAEGAIAAAAKALLVKKVVVMTVAAATAVTGGTAAYVQVRALRQQEARRAAAERAVAVPVQRSLPALPAAPVEEPAAAEPSPPGVLDTLGDERTLLDQARAAIARGRLGEAEAMLARHQQAFPEGRLTEEREALWVRLLVREGHDAEAHRRALQFRQQHPRSIQLPVIDEALRGHH
ncbi:MAG TPA: hypothetical protein VEJ89_07170 [Myxococcaceae bacterium]|jgi:hypothetical protein|nr:hypothetical protein [Myxococcaceae bacterium]